MPDFYNFAAIKLDGLASVLVTEVFDERGKLVDTDLGERMESMFCEMLATLNNRRLIRNGQHISILYLAQEYAAIAQERAKKESAA